MRGLNPGATPDPNVFEQLKQRLRGVLVLELQRRSLWHLSPRCLGIFGPATWQEPGAVDELVADCYCFVFLERLNSLRTHLRVKANIDGLVFRSINNYLYDMQKKHDPLGFRIFSILQLAIRQCCDDGRLHVLAGDGRVRNDTVLGFRTDADPGGGPSTDLSEWVESWNDDLLPDLVTARGKKLDRLVGRLADQVAGLRDVGFEALSFARLLEPLKGGARRRWSLIGAQSEGRPAVDSGAESPPEVLPDTEEFEQHQAFEWLTLCISRRLEQLAEAPTTHDRLRRLWAFLRHQVTEDGDSKTVSRRRVASLLKIPRDSLPGLYSTLGGLVRGCQGARTEDGS